MQPIDWEAGRRLAYDFWPWTGPKPDDFDFTDLAGDGSDRRFVRARAGGRSAVLVFGPDPAENRSYEYIGRHLWRAGGLGPRFYAVRPDQGWFLVEDLGDRTLMAAAESANSSGRRDLYAVTIDLMVWFHTRAAQGFDPRWCHQTPHYDRRLILERETGYFMAAFVAGRLNLDAADPELDRELAELAGRAARGPRTLMHRDFQSRNVMIAEGGPRLVDFQGARIGPAAYDLASLVHDPYAGLDSELRMTLMELYIERRSQAGPFDRDGFEAVRPLLAVCRLLQALGAYGHLTVVKRKTGFARYIRPAWADLAALLADRRFDFAPRLRALVDRIGPLVEVEP
jgi:hypothetical protein